MKKILTVFKWLASPSDHCTYSETLIIHCDIIFGGWQPTDIKATIVIPIIVIPTIAKGGRVFVDANIVIGVQIFVDVGIDIDVDVNVDVADVLASLSGVASPLQDVSQSLS